MAQWLIADITFLHVHLQLWILQVAGSNPAAPTKKTTINIEEIESALVAAGCAFFRVGTMSARWTMARVGTPNG
jgi:hypothetical protein